MCEHAKVVVHEQKVRPKYRLAGKGLECVHDVKVNCVRQVGEHHEQIKDRYADEDLVGEGAHGPLQEYRDHDQIEHDAERRQRQADHAVRSGRPHFVLRLCLGDVARARHLIELNNPILKIISTNLI